MLPLRPHIRSTPIRQELSYRHKIEGLESFRRAGEDRLEKFERFVSLVSISPEPGEAGASTQL